MIEQYRSRIKEYRTVRSEDIQRNSLNFRRHPEHQKTALRGLLTSVGRVAPLLAYQDATGALVCLDGHARLDESDEWDVAILDIDEDEAATVLAMLDKIGADAEIDPSALLALLDTLPSDARQTAGAAWSDDELAAIIGTPAIKPGAGGDEFDPTPDDGPTRTALGELWIIGGVHRLLVGDCTDAANVARLMGGEKPFIMVTDQPYGVEYDPSWRTEAAKKGLIGFATRREGKVENDDRADWRAAWELFDGDVVYCWFDPLHSLEVAGSFLSVGFELRSHIIWAKDSFSISRGHYNWQHECCFYAVRKGSSAQWIGDHSQSTLWKINKNDGLDQGSHGTQKPLECMARPMRNHAGDVYDPFLGSGTTLIAAHRTGRRCYGMEISPRYADVILRRAEAEGLEVARAND